MPAVSALSPSMPNAALTGAGMPVLILDDERFDRHRLARLCSGLDLPCDISNAKTLEEFSDHLEQRSFDLILVDYALPDGNGLDALHMIRLSARNQNAATLMISGQAEKMVTEQAQSIGCSGFLPKDTLSPDSFTAAVERALAGVRQPRPTAKDSFPATEVERLLSLCNARGAGDIKPMISRMMRQMRDLRAASAGPENLTLRAVEQNCMSLWAFLVEMEREDGAVLLAELTAHRPGARERTRGHSRPGKPPSPFGRRPH